MGNHETINIDAGHPGYAGYAVAEVGERAVSRGKESLLNQLNQAIALVESIENDDVATMVAEVPAVATDEAAYATLNTDVPALEPSNEHVAEVIDIKPHQERRKGLFGAGKERAAKVIGVAALAGAVVLTGMFGLGRNSASAEAGVAKTNVTTTSVPKASPTTLEQAQAAKPAEAPTTILTKEQAIEKYGNKITADRNQDLVGQFNIDPTKPEQSVDNFYEELRHNPDALAFWNACLQTGAPSYDSCVSDPATIIKANELSASYGSMDPAAKGIIAEQLINQFKGAEFTGITIENGKYKTIAINANGFFGMENTRYNDPRINFTFTKNGKKYHVQIRECDQITENLTPTPVPTPTPVVPKTPTTTIPKTPTTSTTIPTPTTSTTSTTIPVPTTVWFGPKKDAHPPVEGGPNTTVEAPEPGPSEPTTSQVSEEGPTTTYPAPEGTTPPAPVTTKPPMTSPGAATSVPGGSVSPSTIDAPKNENGKGSSAPLRSGFAITSLGAAVEASRRLHKNLNDEDLDK